MTRRVPIIGGFHIESEGIDQQVFVEGDGAEVGYWTGRRNIEEDHIQRIVERRVNETAQRIAREARDAVRSFTPRRSGEAARAIEVQHVETLPGGGVRIRVGVSESDPDVAARVYWLDQGTRGPIRPVNSKFLRFPDRGGGAFTRHDELRAGVKRDLRDRVADARASKPRGVRVRDFERATMRKLENQHYIFAKSVEGQDANHMFERGAALVRPIAVAEFRLAVQRAASEIKILR